jgi:DNA-binding response OmpR family regulator
MEIVSQLPEGRSTGAIFTPGAPTKSARTGTVDVPASRRERPLDGKRILVVEDDCIVGYELARFIESLGADVAGPLATTAAARLPLEAGPVDGALLDVNPGGETSLDLGRDLAGLAIPVIFVTAHAEESGLFDGPLAAMPRLGKPVARAILQRRAAELFG